MSVVAVKVESDRIVIGSDSIMVSYDSSKSIYPDLKLYHVKDIIIGTCGLASECVLMKAFVGTNIVITPTEKGVMEFFSKYERYVRELTNNSLFKTTNEFIVITQEIAFSFHDFFVRKIEGLHTIGSGCEYAMGALATGASVLEALEIACNYSIHCSRPVEIIEIEKNKLTKRKKIQQN